MIYDAVSMKPLQDCWYPQTLVALNALTNQELQDVIHWIHLHVFDVACQRADGQNVTRAIREFIGTDGMWPPSSALFPLWNKTGQDADYAAMIYGNLVCRIGCQRPELFWSFKEPVAEDRQSRTYVLNNFIGRRLPKGE